MGNIPSQDTSISNNHGRLRDTQEQNTNANSNSNANTLSPSTSNSASVHPLLNPSDLRLKTGSPTTAMAQNDQTTFTNDNTVASSQDITMSGTGASKVNLTSQPSAMNIDTEPLQEPQHEPHPEQQQQQQQQYEQQQQQQQTNQDPADYPPAPPRRRSTLILTDDPDFEKLKMQSVDSNDTNRSNTEQTTPEPQEDKATVPVTINWLQGGENVFITGSFTGWRKMIKLVPEPDNKFSIKLRLPYGTHRFRFIVDNELRFSDYLPTATDQMGNFVNYIEIQSPETSGVSIDEEAKVKPKNDESNLGLTNDDDDMGNGYTRFHEEKALKAHLEYVSDIPAIFTDPSVMEQYYLTLDNNQNQNQNQSWLTPPHLPPHLESVILNNYSAADKSNSSGALPIPNHVVLNHLATTSIKHNTLAVASVVRYKRKYVTQVLYAPLQ